MAGKIFNKASRCLSLRESGLFEDNQSLESAILVAVIHGVHVLYLREQKRYYFIKVAGKRYQLGQVRHEDEKLGLDELVAIVEENHGFQEALL